MRACSRVFVRGRGGPRSLCCDESTAIPARSSRHVSLRLGHSLTICANSEPGRSTERPSLGRVGGRFRNPVGLFERPRGFKPPRITLKHRPIIPTGRFDPHQSPPKNAIFGDFSAILADLGLHKGRSRASLAEFSDTSQANSGTVLAFLSVSDGLNHLAPT